MPHGKETMIVTGGAGFIGSNFVRWLLQETASRIIVVDKLTYAGNRLSLEDVLEGERVVFVQADIADRPKMESIFRDFRPSALFNLAAESHVDRSIDSPAEFIQTNIVGTYTLLDTALKYFKELPVTEQGGFRFLQVSTDEVYGSLGPSGDFKEETPYAPNSPYAASKASADHLAFAYYKTFGLPVLITNCSNNYGPFQYPEKLIPLTLLNALEGKALPIYGDGKHVRDWLYVDDHCGGIFRVQEAGRPGEKYNIGGFCEQTNLRMVDLICETLEFFKPARSNQALKAQGVSAYKGLKTFVDDRPGHDRRYAIDSSKVKRELGWSAAYSLEKGLRKTVEWYLSNLEWCDKVQAGKYFRERLGVLPSKAEGAAEKD